MPANDEVKEYLDYYLSSTLEADFAVMLNGPWGAGKTYFIKEYFKQRDKTVSAGARQRPLRHLYASLYGVRSTTEITDQFFAQAHPILNSKAVRLLGSVASRALNGYAGTEVNSSTENKSIIQDIALNLEGRVLIFDDLERCAMPLVDVMGFINAYVEHEGLKVIVIANEQDIPQPQQSEYLRKKEKLVGKTLLVMSDPKVVIRSLMAKLQNQNVIDTVDREITLLLRMFNASKKHNFRSLRSVLSDFERLATACDSRLREAPEAMTKLLLFMMAAGLEYRSGDLTAAEIASLPETIRSRTISLMAKKEKTPAILIAERLEATYSEVEWKDAIVPPAALAKLFGSGIVDIVAINEHIGRHPLVVGYTETPAWRQLWSWATLPRGQYLKARDQLIAELRERKLTNPGIILHAAGIVIGAADFGDHLLGDEDIVTFFESYIEEVRAAGRLEPARDLFGRMGIGYAGLGYGSRESPEFRRVYATAQAATVASFAERMRDVASTYVDRIAKDPDAYSSLHEYGVDRGNYADAPFLHYIEPDDLIRIIVKDSTPDDRLLASLHARYAFETHNHALADEYPWLKVVRSRLQLAAAAVQPPHKHLLEMRIKYYFDKIDEAVLGAEGSTTVPYEKDAVRS